MFDATAYRKDLSARLDALATSYTRAEAALAELDNLICTQARLPWAFDAVEMIVQRWLGSLVETVSTAYRGQTNARIQYDRMPRRFREIGQVDSKVRHEMACGDCSLAQLIHRFLSLYDFDGLAEWMREHADGLEQAGFAQVADYLANSFGLNAQYRRAALPEIRAGRYQFAKAISPCTFGGGYYHTDTRTLQDLATAFSTMEVCMGVAGGSSILHKVFGEFDNARTAFTSRTVLAGKSEPITVTVFNEKIVFGMSTQLTDALLAFLSLYATCPIVGAAVDECA